MLINKNVDTRLKIHLVVISNKNSHVNKIIAFLAVTKQLYERCFLSVRLYVCLLHLFDYVPIIVSSWNFQELLPMIKVTSMQKVKVRGQRSR